MERFQHLPVDGFQALRPELLEPPDLVEQLASRRAIGAQQQVDLPPHAAFERRVAEGDVAGLQERDG